MRNLRTKVHHIPEGERWDLLSEAQKEVFILVARGYSIAEICQKKKQVHASIDAKKGRAFQWLGIYCNADATAYAIKYGLIEGTLTVAIPRPNLYARRS